MRIERTPLDGVLIVEPAVHGDDRGCFFELFQAERYAAHGIADRFEQDNVSVSSEGVVRGLHFQNPNPQAKLVTVLRGETFSVAVDLRRKSATFGRWTSVRLSAAHPRQLYLPVGFAHGFAALAPETVLFYKCAGRWSAEDEHRLLWNDPDIAVEWPCASPILAPRDAAGTRLRDLPAEVLFGG
jgi:dTDP-4-dehydrorhamnose 3,5-epimerase